MAQPNLLTPTSIIGNTFGTSLSATANTTILTCPADTVFKINSITANTSGNSTDVFVDFFDSSENANLALAGGIDPLAVDQLLAFVNIVTKNTAIYLEEGDEIQAWASDANTCDLIISYEEIT